VRDACVRDALVLARITEGRRRERDEAQERAGPRSATLRSVIGMGGQRVYAGDRLYLAAGMPVLTRRARPPGHPSSRLEIFDGVGHLPQLEAPGRFVAVLGRFLEETNPAQFDATQWRARFRSAADGD
jgi:pimeloyl-ACP methyl ester carboxylesterase